MADNYISAIKKKLCKFILLHRKVFMIIATAIFLCVVLAFSAAQTFNYREILSLYENEVEVNKQLNEQLELKEAHITQLEQLAERTDQKAIRDKERWTAEIEEWEDRYNRASFEHNHVHYAMRLYDMDGPLFVPADMDQKMLDFLLKHFRAWYTGDVETYKTTVSLEFQPEVIVR